MLLVLLAGLTTRCEPVSYEVPRPSERSSTTIPTPTPTTEATSPSLSTLPPLPSRTPIPSHTPTPTPSPSPSPTATPTPTPHIVGYHAHTVAPGEDLHAIAASGGSDPRLIASYNHLRGAPQAGCPLIVPQLAGHSRTMDVEPEPLIIGRGCSGRPLVALTLDAGAESEPTARILAALRERGIRITFFLTGNWIYQNPDLVRQIVADGHEVANHSLTHTDFRSLDDAQIAAELAETEQVFGETTGAAMRPFFRPPYGAYDRRVLLTVIEQGYLPIFWTLDSLDSVGDPKTPEFLVERLTGTLPSSDLPDAILLAHCGSDSTAEAMPTLLDRFIELGLEVRPLSDVLQ